MRSARVVSLLRVGACSQILGLAPPELAPPTDAESSHDGHRTDGALGMHDGAGSGSGACGADNRPDLVVYDAVSGTLQITPQL